MRVLVTGWSGYIGPVVTRALRDAGHWVIGLDTGWFLPNFAEPPEWPDEVIFDDIRRLPNVNVDAVVHLAGLSNDPLGDLDSGLTATINDRGTTRLLNLYHAKRQIVVSSCAVYGGTGVLATEETPPVPLTAYAKAKLAVDSYARRYDWQADVHGWPSLNVASLRLGTVFGYSPGHRLDTVVNRMVYDASRGGPVTARGNALRPFVHVEDVASAIVFMLGRPATGIYNVVGENMRIPELGRAVAWFAGVDLDLAPTDADARDYGATATKLMSLGWAPKRSVEGSLPVLFERTFSLPDAEWPDRYIRLNALKRLIDRGRLDQTTLQPPLLDPADITRQFTHHWPEGGSTDERPTHRRHRLSRQPRHRRRGHQHRPRRPGLGRVAE